MESKFFICNCQTEGVMVTLDYEYEEVCLSFWHQGFEPHKYTMWERIRLAWKLLLKGQVCDDEVILNIQNVTDLIDFLNKSVKKTK